jgi:cell division protein FtsL
MREKESNRRDQQVEQQQPQQPQVQVRRRFRLPAWHYVVYAIGGVVFISVVAVTIFKQVHNERDT